jgi:murein DD-endopeptidase
MTIHSPQARIGTRVRRIGALTAALLLAAGCAPFQRGLPGDGQHGGTSSGATGVPQADTRSELLRVAESRLGAPYRYGGSGPDTFDCSGLVEYAYRQIGIAVPRTAAAQFAAATPVRRRDMQPGDLVFFRLSGRKVGHVGIYLGDDRFVHAPQSGGHVRTASLDEEIFRRGFVGAGRFLP